VVLRLCIEARILQRWWAGMALVIDDLVLLSAVHRDRRTEPLIM
jgi:hypothetical protein